MTQHFEGRRDDSVQLVMLFRKDDEWLMRVTRQGGPGAVQSTGLHSGVSPVEAIRLVQAIFPRATVAVAGTNPGPGESAA